MRDLNNIKINTHRLKRLIKESNTTQLELARRLGMNKDYLNQRIREGYMNEYTLNNICRFLKVSPDYLKGDSDYTVEDVWKHFPSNSEQDKYWRDVALRRVDDDGIIVFSYDQYNYSKQQDDVERQIQILLESLTFTMTYFDEDDGKWVEETETAKSVSEGMVLAVKQRIRAYAKEQIFGFDSDDNSVVVDMFLKEGIGSSNEKDI